MEKEMKKCTTLIMKNPMQIIIALNAIYTFVKNVNPFIQNYLKTIK